MPLVQLLLHDDAYARDLSGLLVREGCFDVVRAEAPDFRQPGPFVADHLAIARHPALLDFPERLVLITPNDQSLLETLWQHNIRAVVFDTDSPATALLAILGSEIGRGEVRPAQAKRPELVVLERAQSSPSRCANLR
jgi:hypothetical protein